MANSPDYRHGILILAVTAAVRCYNDNESKYPLNYRTDGRSLGRLSTEGMNGMPTLFQRIGLYGLLAADYSAIQFRRLWKSDISEHGYWLDASNLGHYFDDALAAALVETFAGKTLIDFGCGKGKYVAFFTQAGIDCRGYDGNPTTPQVAPNCFVADLAKRQELAQADWVMSLEVGEHIPQEFEGAFIDNLTRHAREGLILSWALPSQPGRGHVNCLSNEAVRSRLAACGFTSDLALEKKLRQAAWLPWFGYTVMAFRRTAVGTSP